MENISEFCAKETSSEAGSLAIDQIRSESDGSD